MAVSFNGAVGVGGDLLYRVSGILSTNSAFNISGWIRVNPEARVKVVWYATYNNGGADFLNTGADGVSLYYTRLRDTVTGNTIGPFVLTANVWYHVVVQGGGGSAGVSVYINNVLQGTTPALAMTGRVGPSILKVGYGDPDGQSPFGGEMAYMRAWQTTMGSPERAAEMTNTSAQFIFALYADWRFNNGALSIDSSGQGHHFLVRDTPTYVNNPPVQQVITMGSPPGAPVVYAPKLTKTGAQVIEMGAPIGGPIVYTPTVNKSRLFFDLDFDAQRAEYEFRGIAATRIELNYYPRVAYTGLLWATKPADPTKIAAGGSREIKISPETAEGWKITAESITPLVSGSTITAGGYMPYITWEIHQEGQQIRLFFASTAPVEVSLTIALSGSGYYTKDKQTLVVRDDDLLEANRFRHLPRTVDLSLIPDELEALSLAESLLDLLSHQTDGIFSIGFRFGASENGGELQRRAKVIQTKPGSVIVIRESQSMVEDLACVVLSESYDTDGKNINVNLNLLPVELVGA